MTLSDVNLHLIETFEDAFMSQLALPDGSTVGTWVRRDMAQIEASGKTPPRLLPDYTA